MKEKKEKPAATPRTFGVYQSRGCRIREKRAELTVERVYVKSSTVIDSLPSSTLLWVDHERAAGRGFDVRAYAAEREKEGERERGRDKIFAGKGMKYDFICCWAGEARMSSPRTREREEGRKRQRGQRQGQIGRRKGERRNAGWKNVRQGQLPVRFSRPWNGELDEERKGRESQEVEEVGGRGR
ncbi:hypothetical protein PUN28_005960 [Cardiocondyla obscurior]|uniref:Uncharacterized protein n=1 Tax=Cardiocondyla obscurior TaxID=286306 RepID=A0AAW2G702_9HYME